MDVAVIMLYFLAMISALGFWTKQYNASGTGDEPGIKSGLRMISCDQFEYLLQLESNRAVRYTYFFLLLIIEIDQTEHVEHTRIEDLITRSIRSSDLIGRDDHQQYLLLFPNAEVPGVLRIGDRLRNQVEKQNFTVNGRQDRLTVSIGGACFPTHATEAQELFATAHSMLQKAKSLGGNRICLP
jgi:diguanylate cyclase (GGDEF)-like protein